MHATTDVTYQIVSFLVRKLTPTLSDPGWGSLNEYKLHDPAGAKRVHGRLSRPVISDCYDSKFDVSEGLQKVEQCALPSGLSWK